MDFRQKFGGYGILYWKDLSLSAKGNGKNCGVAGGQTSGQSYALGLKNNPYLIWLGFGEDAIVSNEEVIKFASNEEPLIATYLKDYVREQYRNFAQALKGAPPSLLDDWRILRKLVVRKRSGERLPRQEFKFMKQLETAYK